MIVEAELRDKLLDFLNAKIVHATLMENAKEEGLAEGSKQKEIEIAKNMLTENTDIDFISKVTSLTKEEIESLR